MDSGIVMKIKTKSSLLVLIPEFSTPTGIPEYWQPVFTLQVAEQKNVSGEHDQFRGLKERKKKYQGVPQNDMARSPNSEPHG